MVVGHHTTPHAFLGDIGVIESVGERAMVRFFGTTSAAGGLGHGAGWGDLIKIGRLDEESAFLDNHWSKTCPKCETPFDDPVPTGAHSMVTKCPVCQLEQVRAKRVGE